MVKAILGLLSQALGHDILLFPRSEGYPIIPNKPPSCGNGEEEGSVLNTLHLHPPPLLIKHSAPSFRSLDLICIYLHNTIHLHSRRLMVQARKGGGWLEKREKGRDFVFIKVWGRGLERWQEEDRNKNSHYFLSSLLLSLPGLDSNAKERCQGAGFSVLFCFASSGLGSPAWPPTLLGSGFREKEAGVGGKAVGTEAEGGGRPPS